MNCCVCNKCLDEETQYDYSFWGNHRKVCKDCRTLIGNTSSTKKDVRSESRKRVENLLLENKYDPDIAVELKILSDISVSREEKKQATEFADKEFKKAFDAEKEKKNEKNAKVMANADGSGFLISGIIFLIIAIVLYIASIRPLDRETAKLFGVDSVANIQGTVFSAASFIISIVCFCCKGLVRYMKR